MRRRTRTQTQTQTQTRTPIIRDDGYYYVIAVRLYRLAITQLDRCDTIGLITRLIRVMHDRRGWINVASEIRITLIAAGVSVDQIYEVTSR